MESRPYPARVQPVQDGVLAGPPDVVVDEEDGDASAGGSSAVVSFSISIFFSIVLFLDVWCD